MRDIAKVVWAYRYCSLVHWHITYADSREDMKVIWTQLHEAQLKYDVLLGRKSNHVYPFGKPEGEE